MYCLDASPFDIAVIIALCWQSDLEYESDRWSLIHTAPDKPDHRGILLLVSRCTAKPAEVRVDAVVPGRILRIRLPLNANDGRHLQCIAVCQKAWNAADPGMPDLRHKLWMKLEQSIRAVPSSDTPMVLGDLNFCWEQHDGISVGVRFWVHLE